jgi:HPr kinase/phosphorylase
MCNQRGIPVLTSPLSTDELISRIIIYLAEQFAPETDAHATAVDCYGVGIMIVGPAGIGKSEIALELVERGHLLVADDLVTLRRERENVLMARNNPQVQHCMEIRGVGIVDVKSVFGVGRVTERKAISLIMELEEWDQNKKYDRTGLTEEHATILDVNIPIIRIPVRPGRNIAVIVEVAALNHRLKELGVHSAELLESRVLESKKTRTAKTGTPPPPNYEHQFRIRTHYRTLRRRQIARAPLLRRPELLLRRQPARIAPADLRRSHRARSGAVGPRRRVR